MAEKPKAKKKSNKVYKAYKGEGGSVARLKKSCPKCGTGVFMAAHKERTTCGKCGYTEFAKKGSSEKR